MKVQTIQCRINRTVLRLTAIYTAILMGVAAGNAMAQAAENVRQISHDGAAYQVVDAGAVETAADLRGPVGSAIAAPTSPVQQTGLFCASGACGSGSCRGACGGACGNGYSAYSVGQYGAAMSGGSCDPCTPYCYGLIEALYMEPDRNNRISYSPDFGLSDIDFEFAPRLTIGTLPDCARGCEVTWTGVFNWDRFGSLVDATNNDIQTYLIADSTLTNDELGVFTGALTPPLNPPQTGATSQSQTYDTEYWSIEANRTLVGWDVTKLLFGFRYIEYDEEFLYASKLATLYPTSVLASEVKNQMLGIQAGLEFLYPVGRFAYADFRSRFGVYANFVDSDVQLVNGFSPTSATSVIANFDDDTDVAGMFDIGMGYRYQVGEILSLRGGAEFLYISGIATAIDQLPFVIGTGTGRNVNANDDIFIYGFSFGAEIRL
jgi:hypothetical protein